MKKKSGFTLIELLAVIVILAIIALIATPMVLKYIQNAKEQSGEQSIKAMVKAAETYRMANYDSTDFPMTIYFPDADNTLNLKNIDRANGYLNINDKGDSELLITIDNVTYAKNYGDDKIYNLNKDNYIYDGSSEEWIVSKNNPEKLITWNPIKYGIESFIFEYVNINLVFYTVNKTNFPNNFVQKIEKKETLEATVKEFETEYKKYMRYVPKILKDEVLLLADMMEDKFGSTVNDNSLISDDEISDYLVENQSKIPLQYHLLFTGSDIDFRIANKGIDITTIIPGKVNGNKITTIARDTVGEDCEDTTECITLYDKGNNYYYNLIISEGIEEIGTGYFKAGQVYSLKLPSTLKEIGNTAFNTNHIVNLTLPKGLTRIDNGAFNTNEISGKLVIPDTVTSLGISAFRSNKISEVVISKGLSIIPAQVFAYNQINGKLVIPDNITTINAGAFSNNKITEVVIPASVTTIATNAFGANQIKKVTIEGDKTRFNDIWTKIGFPAELMPND